MNEIKLRLANRKLKFHIENISLEIGKHINKTIEEYVIEYLRKNKKEVVNQIKKNANDIYLYNVNIRLSNLLAILKDGFEIRFFVDCVIDKEIKKIMLLLKNWELRVPLEHVEFVRYHIGFWGYIVSKNVITIDIDNELRNKIMLELAFAEK